MGWKLGLISAAITFSVCSGYTWNAPLNASTVGACLGDNVTFPWVFSLSSSEGVADLEWYFVTSEGNEELIGTYFHDRFVLVSSARQHLAFSLGYGLTLSGVTHMDFGTYYVRLVVNRSGNVVIETRYVYLRTPEPPVIRNQGLVARMIPTAKFVSQDWHVQLACGYFFSTGQPEFTVLWKTPSSAILRSTAYDNGEFVLTLNNPVEYGTYSCSLHSDASTARCVRTSSALEFGAEVPVDPSAVQLAVVNGRLDALRQEVDSLRQESEEMARALKMIVSPNVSAVRIVRLVNGPGLWAGRVEVFYNNTWGTVCDDSFGVNSASVVCRMLGYEHTAPVVQSVYGAGTLPILLDDVTCSGNEVNIFDCPHSPYGQHNCGHNEDVGVDCRP